MMGCSLSAPGCDEASGLVFGVAEDRDAGVPRPKELIVMRRATTGYPAYRGARLTEIVDSIYDQRALPPILLQVWTLERCNDMARISR